MDIGKLNMPPSSYQGSGGEAVTIKSTERFAPLIQEKKVEPRNFNTEEIAPIIKTATREGVDLIEPKDQQKNDSVKRAVEEINRKTNNSEAIFGIHDATNRVIIKIVDKDTRELIKEYPPEETLDMIAKVWELAGIMIDEKG